MSVGGRMISLGFIKEEDAKRFYDILNEIDSEYYYATIPESVEAERKWIERNEYKREHNLEYSYAIVYGEEVVGGCGIIIHQEHNHVGEIGYFIDRNFEGRGIVTKAVQMLEEIAFDELGLVRLEIRMDPRNKASEKVAVKNNYEKEGLLKKIIEFKGNYYDNFLYAKVKF